MGGLPVEKREKNATRHPYSPIPFPPFLRRPHPLVPFTKRSNRMGTWGKSNISVGIRHCGGPGGLAEDRAGPALLAWHGLHTRVARQRRTLDYLPLQPQLTFIGLVVQEGAPGLCFDCFTVRHPPLQNAKGNGCGAKQCSLGH